MLLGDERLTLLIHETWDCLPPESRIEAASRRSPFVFRAHFLLLIYWKRKPTIAFALRSQTRCEGSPQRSSTVLIVYASLKPGRKK
jgi:hypothetical protein